MGLKTAPGISAIGERPGAFENQSQTFKNFSVVLKFFQFWCRRTLHVSCIELYFDIVKCTKWRHNLMMTILSHNRHAASNYLDVCCDAIVMQFWSHDRPPQFVSRPHLAFRAILTSRCIFGSQFSSFSVQIDFLSTRVWISVCAYFYRIQFSLLAIAYQQSLTLIIMYLRGAQVQYRYWIDHSLAIECF